MPQPPNKRFGADEARDGRAARPWQLNRSVRPAKALRENMRYSSGMRCRAYVIAIIASCLGACGGNPTEPSSVEGTYRLAELNGQSVPYDHMPGCCVYTAGSLALRSGQYEASLTFRNKNNQGAFTVGEQGSYSPGGTSIEFRRTGGDYPFSLYDAHLDGSSVRLFLGGDGPGAADQFRALFKK
jgi:hypothetical protein